MTADLTTLRTLLAEAEQDIDRADALGDAAAVVRVRTSLAPRIDALQRAIARAEREKGHDRETSGMAEVVAPH
jgi:hypothetical protein